MTFTFTRTSLLRTSSVKGLTLIETMVSIAIMAFIFAAMAFLIFYTGRNSYIVHDQVRSQTQAAAAAERVANTLRNARQFAVYNSADMSTTLTRLTYGIPSGPSKNDLTTGVVVFVPPSKKGVSDGTIKIYDDVSDYAGSTDNEADWEYSHLADFSLNLNSPYWVTLRMSYIYRGFILSDVDEDGDGIADSTLAGEFVTDAVAKNHYAGENSASYTTSSLASL